MTPLPPPEIVGCYSDPGFTPPLAAMELRWPAALSEVWQTWVLPRGEVVQGRLPRRFGLLIHRQAEDAYAVSLVWDSTCRRWFSLRRQEILASALDMILAAMDTRLAWLLDQPVGAPDRSLPTAA